MARLVVFVLLAAFGVPAFAQEPEAAGRYALVPVKDGALRLDTATGEVALCSEAAGALACRPVPVEAAPGADIASEADRLTALEARIATLEAEALTSGDLLPDEEAMDRVTILADKAIRRFFGLVRDMKREMEEESL